MEGQFNLSLSTLENADPSELQKEALAKIRSLLSPHIDPGAVIFLGMVYGDDIEETLVPYGETWVQLHAPYVEVNTGELEEILIEKHPADSEEPHEIPESVIESSSLPDDVVELIEDLIVEYLDKNQREIRVIPPDYYDGDF